MCKGFLRVFLRWSTALLFNIQIQAPRREYRNRELRRGKIACLVGAQYIGPVQWDGNVMVLCVLCCVFTVTADAIIASLQFQYYETVP